MEILKMNTKTANMFSKILGRTTSAGNSVSMAEMQSLLAATKPQAAQRSGIISSLARGAAVATGTVAVGAGATAGAGYLAYKNRDAIKDIVTENANNFIDSSVQSNGSSILDSIARRIRNY